MALLPKPNDTKNIKRNMAQFVLIILLKKNKHKEPILLLPGRGASTPMWVPNLEGLREKRPVYTIDLLGEPGMSVQTKVIENQKQQAEWLNEVIEGLGLESAYRRCLHWRVDNNELSQI